MSVISVRNLGIRYSVYKYRGRSLKRTVFQFLTRELKREEFWALRHVTLEVREGDSLGVVGPNGAGKSTFCMALAQILMPDEGEVITRGKVAPVLSLGAGFNKDMTGRENIQLSGALMGLQPDETRAVETPITDFAEIGDFIHNPVRTYSSGMRSRLAFSIATSVESDLLILDEAMSVGDAVFRTKSAARMKELMQRAKAIVLVSHVPELVRDLCNVTLWLDQGRIKAYGPTDEVTGQYEQWQRARLAGGRGRPEPAGPQSALAR